MVDLQIVERHSLRLEEGVVFVGVIIGMWVIRTVGGSVRSIVFNVDVR